MTADPTITCPHCGHNIPLTEALARPLVEDARREFEQEARHREQALRTRELELKSAQVAVSKAQAELGRAKEEIEAEVSTRLKAEREAIAKDEARKAVDAQAQKMEAVLADLHDKSKRLAEAQKLELELRRERQQLQEERETLDLEKQRALDAERAKIRAAALKDADEQHRLKLAEHEMVNADLRAKLAEMQRKMDQGSQQLQGEVQELDLESALRAAFPRDSIEPVPRGAHGGDVLHRVIGPTGAALGTILWECKRTKNWCDPWLGKLRGDQRESQADIAALVTQAMPGEIEFFDLRDGVWITGPRCAIPLARCLRQGVAEAAMARQSTDGKQTKMELMYDYLVGPAFRRRVEAIMEAFEIMSDDLETEKRVITRQWAKRAAQIESVVQNTVGMYGDLQGIAGKTMPRIEGLELKALNSLDVQRVAAT